VKSGSLRQDPPGTHFEVALARLVEGHQVLLARNHSAKFFVTPLQRTYILSRRVNYLHQLLEKAAVKPELMQTDR
jgi:hypothetical protein